MIALGEPRLCYGVVTWLVRSPSLVNAVAVEGVHFVFHDKEGFGVGWVPCVVRKIHGPLVDCERSYPWFETSSNTPNRGVLHSVEALNDLSMGAVPVVA